MKHLLVVNYVLDEDDPVLAWQIRVVEQLAARVERVTVLTERRGRGELPANVTAHVLPHRPFGIPRRLGSGFLVGPSVLGLLRRDPPDACFVHMASEWLYRFGWVLRRLHVPVVLWYAHGSVTRRLALALRFADRVVTSTPSGFRIESDKTRVIGQGIDVARFDRPGSAAGGNVVISVGRISRRKRTHLVVDSVLAAAAAAPEAGIRLRLVGPPLTDDDHAYLTEISGRLTSEGLGHLVEIIGFVPHDRLAAQYANVFLHLNLSETGSMDKTVMESLAAGTPVLTSNPAFRDVLADHPEMLLEDSSTAVVAQAIVDMYRRRPDVDASSLRALVVGRHDLDSYADRVLAVVGEVSR